HNPYPETATEEPATRHRTGFVGEGDYARLLRTLAPFGSPEIWYLEDGYQSAVPRELRPRYDGRETVPTLSAALQAERLRASTAGQTAAGRTATVRSRSGRDGFRSSTSRAATSRSRTRTERSSSSRTARSTTTPSSAVSSSAPATSSRRAATPRCTCTCTRST